MEFVQIKKLVDVVWFYSLIQICDGFLNSMIIILFLKTS